MERQFASTELYALENNALALENAIEILKARLRMAPQCVANDVLARCDPVTHGELIAWIRAECIPGRGRIPRDWSPRRNTGVWLLYRAADLACPSNPPRRLTSRQGCL